MDNTDIALRSIRNYDFILFLLFYRSLFSVSRCHNPKIPINAIPAASVFYKLLLPSLYSPSVTEKVVLAVLPFVSKCSTNTVLHFIFSARYSICNSFSLFEPPPPHQSLYSRPIFWDSILKQVMKSFFCIILYNSKLSSHSLLHVSEWMNEWHLLNMFLITNYSCSVGHFNPLVFLSGFCLFLYLICISSYCTIITYFMATSSSSAFIVCHHYVSSPTFLISLYIYF
jgi:hypothetical protein